MRVTNGTDGAEEILMVLPLGVDPGAIELAPWDTEIPRSALRLLATQDGKRNEPIRVRHATVLMLNGAG